MKKEHKVRINQAIDLCEERFNAFDKHVNDCWPKADAVSFRKFLLDNTVFAGGVFRSVFTKNTVKDVDVFFTSTDASIEFQHRMMMANHSLFTKNAISANHTYNWGNGYGGAALSFITEWADTPENLMRRFDFSFNQHYFNLNTYEMRFDADTFNRAGQYLADSAKTKHALRYYMRAIRFQQEGMQLTRESWYQIAKTMTGLTYHEVTNLCQAMSSNGDGQQLHTPELTGIRYTENDYFGVNKSTKKNMYTLNIAPEAWEQNTVINTTNGPMVAESTMDTTTGVVTTRIVPMDQMTRPVGQEFQGMTGEIRIVNDGVALNAIEHPNNLGGLPETGFLTEADLNPDALEDIWIGDDDDDEDDDQ